MKKKRFDLLILILFIALGSLYALLTAGTVFNKPLFVSTAVLLPQIIYLSLRGKKNWKKILVGTFIFGVIFCLFLETLAELSGAWHVPEPFFTFRFFGYSTIDAVIGYIWMTLLTFLYYEHFLNPPSSKKISPRIKYAIIPSIFFFIAFVIILLVKPEIFHFEYQYLVLGSAVIIFPIILSFFKPKLLPKLLLTAVYFAFLYSVAEIFGVMYDWWIYPGNYIGTISFGDLSFPFEEFLFWILFYAATLVSYYEVFIDDMK